jgi:RNA polymerase sigma-70 factor (ECF subfamily)
MAGPVIAVERGAPQAKRGLSRAWLGLGSARGPAQAEDRSYASPESLFMDHYEPLARAVTFMTQDPEAARDAVQEAFVRLCREWPTVSGYRHQVAWVRKVAVNVVWDQLRKQDRQARLFVSMDEDEMDLAPAAATDSPAEGNPELWKAVRELPEKQRMAVGLFYVGDLDITEVSAAMGVSRGTVNRHLNRARNTLRTKMEA